MTATTTTGSRIDDANIRLYKELAHIKTALDVYRLIGLNAVSVRSVPGHQFFAITQMHALRTAALGLAKVYERNDRYKLCSISGIYNLIKENTGGHLATIREFTARHGVAQSDDWKADLGRVVENKHTLFEPELTRLKVIRDQSLAHMDQDAPTDLSPGSFDSLEQMLAFADEFHGFVHAAFVGGYAEPVSKYNHVENHLVRLLTHLGVTPATEFPG